MLRRAPGRDDAALAALFGDTTPGASMDRFLEACDHVIRERDAALVARAARPEGSSGS